MTDFTTIKVFNQLIKVPIKYSRLILNLKDSFENFNCGKAKHLNTGEVINVINKYLITYRINVINSS